MVQLAVAVIARVINYIAMTVRIIKFKYGSDIRKLMIERHRLNFSELMNVVRGLYKDKLPDNLEVKFKYIDGGSSLFLA